MYEHSQQIFFGIVDIKWFNIVTNSLIFVIFALQDILFDNNYIHIVNDIPYYTMAHLSFDLWKCMGTRM